MARRKGAKLDRREGETVSAAKARRRREAAAKARAKGQADPRDKEQKFLDRLTVEGPTPERLRQSGGVERAVVQRSRSALLGPRLLEDMPAKLRQMAAKGTVSQRELMGAGALLADYRRGYLSGGTTRYAEKTDGGGSRRDGMAADQLAARTRFERAKAGVDHELWPHVQRVVLDQGVVSDGPVFTSDEPERAARYGVRAVSQVRSAMLGLALRQLADFYNV